MYWYNMLEIYVYEYGEIKIFKRIKCDMVWVNYFLVFVIYFWIIEKFFKIWEVENYFGIILKKYKKFVLYIIGVWICYKLESILKIG